MVFSSIEFLFYFLPIFLLINLALPKACRNLFLLIASLFFYFWGERAFALILIISSVIDFVAGLWIEKHHGSPKAKWGLWLSLAANLGMLFFFKYADFFISIINSVMGLKLPLLRLHLPLGISFFTFQTMSYSIDVYRGRAKAQRSLVDFAAYVAMFPQLVAGPIVRYTTVEKELNERRITISDMAWGIKKFSFGLGKKVLIANQLGELVKALTDSTPSIAGFWGMAIGFSLQIYFDFSGYSDMAIGIGKMLGFSFPENFNYPYIARSISEFWQRWHISMTSWFREYIYIPLGGNRVGQARWLFNILIVWLATGLWHGANWNYVIWGLYFAVIMTAEKLLFGKSIKHWPKILSHLYVLIIVVVSFVIFYNENMSEAFFWLKNMFGLGNIPITTTESLYYLRSYGVILVMAIIGATPIFPFIGRRIKTDMFSPVVCGLILILSTAFLVDSAFNPFLYFRF